jgi:hypothetical protein
LAFNSNDDPAGQPAAGAPDVAAPPAEASPAMARFTSCRWQQPAEDGNAAFCTHREVKPLAGTASFDPSAWCEDCEYYKLRRTPKRRAPEPSW